MVYRVGNHFTSRRADSLAKAYLIYRTFDGKKYLMNQTTNEIIDNNQGWRNTPNEKDAKELDEVQELLSVIKSEAY